MMDTYKSPQWYADAYQRAAANEDHEAMLYFKKKLQEFETPQAPTDVPQVTDAPQQYDSFFSKIPGFLEQPAYEATGAAIGGAAGAAFGPASPLTVPIGTALGGAMGHITHKIAQKAFGRLPPNSSTGLPLVFDAAVRGAQVPVYDKVGGMALTGAGMAANKARSAGWRAWRKAFRSNVDMGKAQATSAALKQLKIPEAPAYVFDSQTLHHKYDVLSNTPFIGDKIRKVSQATNEKLGSALDDSAQMLGGGKASGRAFAGEAIQESAASVAGRVRDRSTAYKKAVLKAAGGRIKVHPKHSAETVKKMQELGIKAYMIPVKKTKGKVVAKVTNTLGKQVTNIAPGYEPMSLDQAMQVKSELGSKIDDFNLSNTERQWAKRQYSAITSDIEDSIQSQGGESTKKLWKASQRFYRRAISKPPKKPGMPKRPGPLMTAQKMLRKDVPERLYDRIATKNPTEVLRVRGMTKPEQWSKIRSQFIQEMGKTSQKNPDWSPTTFYKAYEVMSPEMKKTMFGKYGGLPSVEEKMKAVAVVSKAIKDLKSVQNVSFTGSYIQNERFWNHPIIRIFPRLATFAHKATGGEERIKMLIDPKVTRYILGQVKPGKVVSYKSFAGKLSLLAQQDETLKDDIERVKREAKKVWPTMEQAYTKESEYIKPGRPTATEIREKKGTGKQVIDNFKRYRKTRKSPPKIEEKTSINLR